MGQTSRNYCCFVCGVEYKTWEDFESHIKQAHELGREYVLCPKCDAPVRDLCAHYKAKHPNFPFPAGVQRRATVWNDFRSGVKKQKKLQFKEGTFISKKMNGKEMYYRSSYELDVYKILEDLPEVVSFVNEPFEIPYFHEGRWHNYRPDIIVTYADSRKELWEIKPKSQTTLPINESKWSYAAKWCQDRNMSFMVLTEIGISKLKKQKRRS